MRTWNNEEDVALCKEVADIYAAIRQRDANEILGYAWEGVLDARRLWKEGMGASWRTYAKFRIRGAIIDNLRKTVNWGGRYQKFFVYSLNHTITGGVVEGSEVAEFISTMEDDYAKGAEYKREINEELEHVMKKAWLTKRECEVCRLAAQGYVMHEIGAMLGVTEARICQIFRKIKEKAAFYHKGQLNYA